MIRAKMTPMIGRGAPAATASKIPLPRMSRDWISFKGLKRAKYEELADFKPLVLDRRENGFSIV